MGRSKQNRDFDSQAGRGMHRSEDDLGYLDQGMPADTIITPDPMTSGEATITNTATIQAQTKIQSDQQTSPQEKRANQSDR